VAEDDRHRVRERSLDDLEVGVAEAARVEADEHVVGPEGAEGHALDDERAADLVQDRGAKVHGARGRAYLNRSAVVPR
jgi:hypothetical protein